MERFYPENMGNEFLHPHLTPKVDIKLLSGANKSTLCVLQQITLTGENI